MRDFGLGKQSIDERIQDEAGVLVEQFRRQNGQPFDPKTDIFKAVSNIICSITFGKRLVIWPGSKIYKFHWIFHIRTEMPIVTFSSLIRDNKQIPVTKCYPQWE